MPKDAVAGRQELTQAALLRIIEKTRSKHYTPPADLNRAELSADIRNLSDRLKAYESPSPFDPERRELLQSALVKARSLRDFVVKHGLYRELSIADFKNADYTRAFGRAIDGLEAALRVQVPSGRVEFKSVSRGTSMPPGTA